MKKRVFLTLLIAVLAVGAAFAQEIKFSAGVGGFFGSDFGGGVQMTGNIMGGLGSLDVKDEFPYSGGGAYAFFDATYAELSIGYFSGKLKPKFKGSTKVMGIESSMDPDDYPILPNIKIQSLNIGLLGKYPIAINDSFSFFPLLGIEYQVALSVKDEKFGEEYRRPNPDGSDGDKAPGDWSSLWFKAGAGMDFSFTESLYLRLDVLYGIRLPSKAEKDFVDFMKMMAGEMDSTMTVDAKTLLGHGLTAKLAIGFRF
jgi:opacity protein-like surface antigen